MNLYATRLRDGQDLKQAIIDFAIQHQVSAAVVVSAVGSLRKASLRMAGAAPDKQDMRTYDEPLEIVSLTGTIAKTGQVHLHMAVSNKDGQVVGGHLKDGCIVHTTVELVLASASTLNFTREIDAHTGFDELTITTQA